MDCNQICSKYKISALNLKKFGIYEQGYKRCSSCSVYIDYKGTKCPCCGNNLRTKPRNSIGRKKISNKRIFDSLQEELTLSDGTINYSKKLFTKIKNKTPFVFQSKTTVIATCIFIAAKFKHEPKPMKEICRVSEEKKDLLELTCNMALDDLKETLVTVE